MAQGRFGLGRVCFSLCGSPYQIRKAGYPPTNSTLAARVVHSPRLASLTDMYKALPTHTHHTHCSWVRHNPPTQSGYPAFLIWVPRFSNLCGGHVRVMWGGCGIMSRVKSEAVDMHISLGTLCVGPISTPHPSHTPHNPPHTSGYPAFLIWVPRFSNLCGGHVGWVWYHVEGQVRGCGHAYQPGDTMCGPHIDPTPLTHSSHTSRKLEKRGIIWELEKRGTHIGGTHSARMPAGTPHATLTDPPTHLDTPEHICTHLLHTYMVTPHTLGTTPGPQMTLQIGSIFD